MTDFHEQTSACIGPSPYAYWLLVSAAYKKAGVVHVLAKYFIICPRHSQKSILMSFIHLRE
jgi:hypothetical protein